VGAILFTCPSTGFSVQHWLDDDERDEDDYEGVTGPPCSRVHFVNREGKVLGATSNEAAGASLGVWFGTVSRLHRFWTSRRRFD
jgi:hypothetical protein